MSAIKNWIVKHLPLVVFHVFILAVIITNFHPGKYFLIWDSITPEFNFLINFRRAIFAMWQENYGVGLLGGHGFAATLPHTIILYVFSWIAPLWSLRQIFTLLCFYLGGLGMYFLIQQIFYICNLSSSKLSIQWYGVIAALFYSVNSATVQQFYVQLEAFIGHFAALPWLFWIIIKCIQNPNKKNIILFIVINFFASLQGFIPPLFIAYMISLGIFLTIFILNNPEKKKAIVKSIVILVLTLVVNAYWFIPVTFYTFNLSSNYLASYNNLKSTPMFADQSIKHGNIGDVAMLKGFYLDSYQLNEYIFQPWLTHHEFLPIKILGIVLFVLILFGILYSLLKIKNWIIYAFVAIFAFFFIGMATDTVPFSYITKILQYLSPTYRQAFRITFTKLGLGLAFTYSIFLAIGLYGIMKLIGFKKERIIVSVIIGALIWYGFPFFGGNLIYKKGLLNIPPEYINVMNYFKDKPQARIADFPQECSEGWYTYKWGYFGSGFYWYGIEQPFMSRTFDVWSASNENYYWELTHILRRKQFENLPKLFQKYNVQWIVFDQNLAHCRNPRGLSHYDDLIDYLKSNPEFSLEKTYQSPDILPIDIYEYKNIPSNTYVSIEDNLKNIQPEYKWTDDDSAYYKYGSYTTNSGDPTDTYFPFRSLFTQRSTDDNNIIIKQEKNKIVITAKTETNVIDGILKLPAYKEIEKIIPITLDFIPSGLNYRIDLSLQLPIVTVNGTQITTTPNKLIVGEIPTNSLKDVQIYINGEQVEIKQDLKINSIFSTQIHNSILLLDSSGNTLVEWNGDELLDATINNSFLASVQGNINTVSVEYPVVENENYSFNLTPNLLENSIPESCNEIIPSLNNKFEFGHDLTNKEYLRLISKNSKQCVKFTLQNTETSEGYIIALTTRNVKGLTPSFYVTNRRQIRYLDPVLSSKKDFHTNYLILPPTIPGDLFYDFVIENISYNATSSVNDISDLSVWQFPYDYVRSIEISNEKESSEITNELNINHPYETYYSVQAYNLQGKYLVLNQGYHNGWVAYENNQELEHIKVNNWANGWILPPDNDSQSTTITIVFWPQILQHIGYLLLIFSIVVAILFPSSMHKKQS